jgi:internalin A
MKRLVASTVLCVAFVLPSNASADDEADAIAAVKDVGGTIYRDEKDPAKPVVNVVFKSGEEQVNDVVPYLKFFPKLRALSFPYARTLDDEGMKSLNKLTGLTSLTLVGTSITDKGLEQLASLKNLESLQLSNSAITDAGLKHLVGMKKLKFLELNATKVTGASLKDLQGLTALEHITFFNTPLNDAGAKQLASFKSLKRVELSKSKVSETATAELKKAMPDLTID